MQKYRRLFTELTHAEDMTQAAHNAIESVQELDIQDDVEALMARVNKRIKQYMQKKNYTEDSDVTNFATAIQEQAIKAITDGIKQGDEWKLISVVLAMAVSLGMKVNEQKGEQEEKQAEAAPEPEV